MKKTISLICAVILLFNIAVITAPAYADAKSEAVSGTFTYLPANAEATQETFYYSDDFFAESSKNYNGHLLVMSFDLAISTFEARGASYVTKLFEDVGFTDVSIADMLEKPSRDTIGTAVAHKKIADHNVIAVAIRGEKYDGEWASNFIVGKTGNAKGFNDASVKVLDRIKAYISDHGLENNKIWIVGYSRAGAIADLAGVYINNNPAEFGVTADDLYVYAFEPPAASLDDTVYDNIYAVENKNDIVPLVYPASWGFHTNGKVTFIGGDQTMTTYLDLTSPREHGTVETSDFISDFIDWLSDRLTRDKFANELEAPLADLLEIFFSKSDADRAKILSFFSEDVLPAVMEGDSRSDMISYAWSVMSHESDYLYHQIADILTATLDSTRGAENASALTDAEYETLKNSVYPILRALGPVLVDDMIYFDGIDYDDYYVSDLPDLKSTDADLGKKYGTDLGSYDGYSAGFEGEEADPDPYYSDDYGPDYEAAYAAAYKAAYAVGYALGCAHRADLAAKGAYDGEADGSQNGYGEGLSREPRTPYNEWFYEEDWMTEEYVDAYNKAYEEAYNTAYDRGAGDDEPEESPMALDSYHVLSLVKNISAVTKNHVPQTNISLVKLAGHDYELTDSKEASCEEDGYRSYHCPTCGDVFVLTVEGGHKLHRVDEVRPSADADGNISYYVCEQCGKLFASENADDELDPASVILKLGDVNRDGSLNAKDVIAIMRYIVGYEDEAFDRELSDYNGDHSVNARDVTVLMKRIAANG